MHAAVYLISYSLSRGLSLFLTPLYTRVMSASDFAQLAIANTALPALTIVIGISLHSCIPRLYHEYSSDLERREFLGTVTLGSIALSLGVGGILNVGGRLFAVDSLDSSVRSFLELVIWSAVALNFCAIPIALFTAAEKPATVSVLNISTGALQLAMNLLLVAVMRQGALGVLRAGLISSALMALISFGVLRRRVALRFSWSIFRAAAVYCLPLVPHLLANWALAISDRLILARHVSSVDLACYAVAYLPATGVALVGGAVVTPVTAAANRQLGNPGGAEELTPLGTYAFAATVYVALLVSVSATEMVRLLAPPLYAPATRPLPWVVLGGVFQTAYLLLSIGTWYSKRTGAVPIITGISVAANLGINFALVPRFGMMVAAYSTVIGYAICAVLHGLVAHRNHPIPWPLGRWVAIVVSAIATYLLVHGLELGTVAGLVVKSSIASVVFVLGLIVLRVVPAHVVIARAKSYARHDSG